MAESLIYGLFARSIIRIGAAIDIVGTTDSVQIDVAEIFDKNGGRSSRTLLAVIAGTSEMDCEDELARLIPH